MLEHLGIQQRFRVLLVFTLACFTICGFIVYRTLSEIRVNGPLYERIMQGQDLVADILPPPSFLVESYLTAMQMEAAPTPERQQQLLERLHRLQADYMARYRHWQAASLQGELQSLFLNQSHSLALAFYDQAFNEFAPALQRHDQAASARALAGLGVSFELQRGVLEQVIKLAHQRNAEDEAAARARIRFMGGMLALVFALTAVGFVLIYNTVRRSIADPIIDALNITRKIAAGDWRQQFRRAANDEAGHLITAIRDIVKNTQNELVKSEKMAALGSLVAGVSHELNTPVGNGLMAVSTLGDDLRQFRQRMNEGLKRSMLDEFLQAVELGTDIATRNLQRAADLMTSFKQVAVDRSSSQRRRFMLDQVVHETQMTLHPMLKRAMCLVRQEIPSAIQFDSFPGPLGQVISNMIENAVRHAFEGGVGGVIVLSARRLEASGMVVISVEDNGKGIPLEMQGHVFEPFFTTRLGQGGSGLGLHISHNLVYEVLGGTITLNSTQGEGTRFDIAIPLVAPGV